MAAPVQLLCILFIASIRMTSQSLQTGSGNGLPELRDYRNDDNDKRITRHQQAIIHTYRFNSCGNITEWGVDVFRNVDNAYALDFQVWRPSPTVADPTGAGCYSLVGNNRFTSIPLNDGVARVTPSPQDHIQFQSGDVLGFYVEDAGDDVDSGSTRNGVVMLHDSSELVWYASIAPSMATSQSGGCPYSVGSNGVLDSSVHAAPVISIETTTYPCPSSLTVATTLYTSPIETPNIRVLTTDPNTVQEDINKQLLIGTVAGAAVLVAVIIMLVVVITVCQVKARAHNSINSEKSNEALTDEIDAKDGIHEFPIADHNIDTKENEAYVVRKNRAPSIEIKQNVAYCSSGGIATQRKEVYDNTNIQNNDDGYLHIV